MQVLNERQKEVENHRVALATAKSQYEQAKDGLHRAKETEVRICILKLKYRFPLLCNIVITRALDFKSS